jgi:hypothetical protein
VTDQTTRRPGRRKTVAAHKRIKRSARGETRKTLTLTPYDAEHVYEWLRWFWLDDERRSAAATNVNGSPAGSSVWSVQRGSDT